MKKLLALVLAMVMTLGLATVGTNAAATKFSDDDTIKYAEAAAVMSAIGVFDGDDSNSFRPTATLKRSEAAKIVAYLMLTKKTADGLSPSGTRYNDVPANHWAAGYIEYLTAEGVLGGVGDGRFNPDGDITVVDYAKMLMVALGYDAKIENLILSDYRINTTKLANKLEIFEGNEDAVPTDAITRDQASLFAFNMIRKPMVEYDTQVNVKLDNGNIAVGSNRAYQRTSSNLSKQTISVEEAARNDQYNSGSPFIVEFAEDRYPDLENTFAASKNQTGRDQLGRPVREWYFKNTKIGSFVRGDMLVNSWTKKLTAKMVYDELGNVYYDAAKNGRNWIEGWTDGVEYVEIDYGKTVVDPNEYGNFNANKKTSYSNLTYANFIDKDSTYKINNSDNSTVSELYTDKDRNMILVSYNTYPFQVAGDYNTASRSIVLKYAGDTKDFNDTPFGTNITLRNNFRVDEDDFSEIKDLKNDDYVTVNVAYLSNGVYEVKGIDKATVLSGKVDTYNYEEDYKVTIDGTKYSYNRVCGSGDDQVKKTEYTVGEEAKVVLDKNGYVCAVDEAVVTNNYVFIREFGTNSGTLSTMSNALAAAVFTDGTTADIKLKSAADYTKGGDSTQVTSKTTIASWNESKAAGNSVGHANLWYSYSKNSAGEYTLYKMGNSYAQGSARYQVSSTNTSIKALLGNYAYFMGDTAGATWGTVYTSKNGNTGNTLSKNILADDKTIMVVRDHKDKFNVYTGVKSLPDITVTYAAYTDGIAAGKNPTGVAVYPAYKTSNQHANVVYVDAYNDGANIRISGAANDNLVYITKYSAATRTTDNEVFYSYVTLDGTTEVTKESEDKLVEVPGKIFGAANYLSVDSKGRLTGLDLKKIDQMSGGSDSIDADAAVFGYRDELNASTDVVTGVSVRWNGSIIYKNGTLMIGDSHVRSDSTRDYNEGAYVVSDDAKITVVTVGDGETIYRDSSLYPMLDTVDSERVKAHGSAMAVDKAAGYEVNIYTGKSGAEQMANRFLNYAYAYDYQLRLDASNDRNNVIKELYVTVLYAYPVASDTNTTTVSNSGLQVTPNTDPADYNYSAIDLTLYSGKATPKAISDRLTYEMELDGCSNINIVNVGIPVDVAGTGTMATTTIGAISWTDRNGNNQTVTNATVVIDISAVANWQ